MEVEFEDEGQDQTVAVADLAALARQLVDGTTTLQQYAQLDGLYSPLVDDIQQHVDRFGAFSARGGRLPCITSAGDVPIPLDASSIAGANPHTWEMNAAALAARVSHLTQFQVHMLPRGEARESFVTRIGRALGVRFGSPDAVREPGAPVAGLEVEVNTPRTTGGRVFYSAATLFNANQLFGAPTSPVTRPILPGVYLFGVEDSAGGTAWDSAEYEIPPNYRIELRL